MCSKGNNLLGGLIVFFYLFFGSLCSLTDTIYQGQELKKWQNLTSANGIYRLQFFGTSSSPKSYLGIYDTRTYFVDLLSQGAILWLANRNNPISDPSMLTIDANGTLKITYTEGVIILSSVPTTQNVSATLLDSGNFVLREVNSKKIIWQSFDYPTSFLLPDMKIGIDFKSGQTRVLTSWVSSEIPAYGSFTFGVDPNKTDQLVIWNRGNVYWTSGPCNDGRFKNAPLMFILDTTIAQRSQVKA